MTWPKRRIFGFVIGMAIGLTWITYSFVTLGIDASLPYLAILVAALAAMASFMCLQWARDTVRPFLFFTGDIDVGGKDDERYMTFHIKNSGVMPGSNVRIEVVPFGIDEEITTDNTGKRYSFPKEHDEPIIIFPNLGYQAVRSFDLKRVEDKNVWESIMAGKVKLRIKIFYESLRRKHETIQSIHIDQFDAVKAKLWGLIVEPQMWK